ncbi:MAG: SDR family oxidoreductase [Candidatus Latescibacterota bacterium]
MKKRALILGAKSVIAQAIVLHLADEGYDFVLAARDIAQLDPFAADLKLRCKSAVELLEFDALDWGGLEKLPQRVEQHGGAFDLVVLVFGHLGDQKNTQHSTQEMLKVLHSNFTAAAVVLGHLANYLEEKNKGGGIIGISSVAGDRGRQSNFFYGAAKGGLTLFLQGLRNRLAPLGIHVLTVKPGFVDTPMTEGLDGLFLVAKPEKVAADIVRAYKKKKDVLYTPFFWRWIMLIIRSIPERVFKKMKL